MAPKTKVYIPTKAHCKSPRESKSRSFLRALTTRRKGPWATSAKDGKRSVGGGQKNAICSGMQWWWLPRPVRERADVWGGPVAVAMVMVTAELMVMAWISQRPHHTRELTRGEFLAGGMEWHRVCGTESAGDEAGLDTAQRSGLLLALLAVPSINSLIHSHFAIIMIHWRLCCRTSQAGNHH